MKPADRDDLWPRPQWYSIVCPQCGRPAARLVYQEPVARYLHYSKSRGLLAHSDFGQANGKRPPKQSGTQELSLRAVPVAEVGHQLPHLLFGAYAVGTLNNGLLLGR